MSSSVPVESTRLTGSPLTLCATTVSTSQGLVTSTRTALGACSSSSGTSLVMMPAFTPARSSRVWPGFCRAPAVMMMTEESFTTEMSEPPVTTEVGVNWVPWARSWTSASTFLVSMS